MALKLDMSKAYNRIEWSFVEGVLSAMGFPIHLIQLIMRCISTISYQILINEQPNNNFKLERGLRQDDPLSPSILVYFIC